MHKIFSPPIHLSLYISIYYIFNHVQYVFPFILFHSVRIALSGTGLSRTFKMPAHHVTISAVFRDTRTAIEDMQSVGLTAYAPKGTLHVSGLLSGEQWSVYNITGTLIVQSVASETAASLPLSGRGVYIVRSGDKVVKVVN